MTKFKTDISKQGKQFELVFTTDNKDYFEKVQSVARECIDHKPITQFDRIKAMSVEQMASKIVEIIDCKMCPVKNTCETWQSCEHEVIKWLESEVRE